MSYHVILFQWILCVLKKVPQIFSKRMVAKDFVMIAKYTQF